jgi:hypothetical protein
MMNSWKRIRIAVFAMFLVAGCSMPVLREHAQPSETKDQYLRIKRIAIFPFENYSDTKEADKVIDVLLTTALREEGIFDKLEDTRFVRDAMKKMKITSTDILDKEVVKKLADEINVQGIIYGKIIYFGKGKEKDAPSQVTMDMSMLEPSTGSVLWIGNVTASGGLTLGKVFGVTEGKTDIEVARAAVRKLASSLASDVKRARDKEQKGVSVELKKEEEKERARLEQLKGETGKIQSELEKAKADAKGIRDAAAKEAEAIKTDLELQKAAIESEKAKTSAAQQVIDQEKLKVDLERKKLGDDLKKIEEEKRKLEEAQRKAPEVIKEEPVKETAPAVPALAPAVPAPAPPAPAPPPEAEPIPAAPAPAPAPAIPALAPAVPAPAPPAPAPPPEAEPIPAAPAPAPAPAEAPPSPVPPVPVVAPPPAALPSQ